MVSDLQSGGARAATVRVLGIDPGSQRTGVGIIDVAADGRITHVHHQPLVLLDAESFPLRLRKLLDGLWALIEQYRPDEVGVEQVFLSNNAMSALKLGQARGAAIAACVARDLPVSEYAAKEIKLGLVGSGGADKKQVQHMVAVMLGLTGKLQADAADALAVAITHAHVRASANRLGVDARAAWGRKGRGRR
ncbi:crossover junction endodeoxyribonuclease RuvC [Thermomonas sp. XSG]|jgi:crossover junction endodeoxyribonuclease RuvC|uniref:crossover junction endodeoxyribonuclease RuvC n=1 Tax=Thermomonas sp. XSG TaxID=2771436 RepID=UPI001680ECBA|nr:crossover junction endodeoxyribonuclease RuvC [Thermomonas sp. XSG]QNU15616.1 crossover junction endodeoxyribonuclease RuvC [Thermomonas sp. XSG]